MATINVDFSRWAQGIAFESDTGTTYAHDAYWAMGMPVAEVEAEPATTTRASIICGGFGTFIGA